MQTQVEALFKFQGDWIINHVIQLQGSWINFSIIIININVR